MAESVPAAWMIRAGRDGERESQALTEGLVIAGWDELGDIGGAESRQDLRRMVRKTYPDDGKARIANWTGQLWRFVDTIKEGDHVVLPLKTHPGRVAVGRITGPYIYRYDAPEGFRHVRPVKWIRTNISRDDIRQDLLDSLGSLLTVCGLTRFDAARRVAHLAAHGTDPGVEKAEGEYEASSRPELLAEAADRSPDDPVRLTIRTLLGHWDAARRTPNVVAEIEEALEEKGLATRPAFTEGWVDNFIQLVPVGEEPVVGETSFPAQVADDTEDASELPRITLRIGDLRAANDAVESVRPEDSLHKATTLMVLKNYSQLAVVSEDGTFYGAVSWESIGRAQVARASASLADATVAALVVEYHEPLLEQIDQIYTRGFVFVRSQDKSGLCGIVTAADLTRRFDDLARPFVLIEEIERRLRRRVNEKLTLDEIRSSARRRPEHVRSAGDLTLGNFPYLLEPPERWAKLEWSLDHQLFLDLMKAVAGIRNETMHFSPDPLTGEQMSTLTGFLDLLRTVDPNA
ncbi:CBS domain protein [Actinomadura rubteroloni]|uniref:CBS domain protein n=1 Tax=Actinomadura rubteroloni TaxID=1926885 RepID=A0A2P4UM40_9ACTN|nr:CBS domain-containing protein [Actinomadura rubteroloni]POM26105.1 CBS domain protein [Actinomadura rubteroloni]